MAWLNYHHRLYFWTVVRQGGVSKAAVKLRLSQPTVSAQVKMLEGSLGERLLERQGRTLVLTEVGRVVYGGGQCRAEADCVPATGRPRLMSGPKCSTICWPSPAPRSLQPGRRKRACGVSRTNRHRTRGVSSLPSGGRRPGAHGLGAVLRDFRRTPAETPGRDRDRRHGEERDVRQVSQRPSASASRK